MKRIKNRLFRMRKKAVIYAVGIAEALVVLGGTTACSANDAGTGTYITLEEAEEIALTDAGLTASELDSIKVNSDLSNGVSVYDIEFYAGNTKYEYEVKADTGSIYSRSKEKINSQGTALLDETNQDTTLSQEPPAASGQESEPVAASGQGSEPPAASNQGAESSSATNSNGQQSIQGSHGQISLEEAKNAALADAGQEAANVVFTKEKLDYEDGIAVYDIEFYAGNTEYEYEIHAQTGAVYSKDVETHNTGAGHVGQDSHGQISLEEAKNAALADAGQEAANVVFTKEKLDYEDGIAVYDIEFYAGNTEYEYEIHAQTGAVYSKDVETHDIGVGNGGNAGSSGTYIGEEQAKSIAVNHAGFSAADVSGLKSKFEIDDGRAEYEVEFYKDGKEYDYTINALDGAIIKYDMD